MTDPLDQLAIFDERPRCRSCGAPIIWALSTKGKRTPVDADSVIGGTIQLIYTPPDPTPVARVLSYDERVELGEDTGLFVSHFATCPQSKQWRT